ncbi:MAG: beta-ketoacyl synthase N-terminal-like domain-containing protein [Pseudomonas sp.]|uniref:type I polyketide synthase n=1 Tax=Pseudomonas sp. TaxID=306 RepID=UPI0033971323
MSSEIPVDAIAVVGMAGRFPGAADVDEFWRRLVAGEELTTRFSLEELAAKGVDEGLRDHPNYVPVRGVIPDYDCFDAELFGYTPRDAALTDPQQRLLLETAWTALEHAGYDPSRYPGLIGVYAGVKLSSYLFNLLSQPGIASTVDPQQLAIANDKDHAALQIAYRLNLTGPAVAVQTTCSTSLVAVQMACQSLLGFQCDMALAGGAALRVPAESGYLHVPGGVMSPDGHCRAFDAQAAGTVPSDGVGLVLLKRLEDALADNDSIHALILGAAINNDGARKVSYMAPSPAGQSDAIRAAHAMAGIDPASISYVETHGTATRLGDPIEIQALTRAFRQRTQAKGFCAIGSLKSAAGHIDVAAGVSGLIKTVQALRHRTLPPSLHYHSPNPAIDFSQTPFYVNTQASAWNPVDGVRRAAVSSFGFGGTNAHVVLQEAPVLAGSPKPTRAWQLLPLSARTPAALDALEHRMLLALKEAEPGALADAAWTLQQGRARQSLRRVLALGPMGQCLRLDAPAGSEARAVAFVCGGQGAQFPGMARALYDSEPLFRAALDHCCAQLALHLQQDLTPWLLDPAAGAAALQRTALAQPALFVLGYAQAQLWRAWGIEPAALIGHSLGELLAATLAGVFDLDDALRLVAARGRLMDAQPEGAMTAVSLDETSLRAHLGDGLELAVFNGPHLCVVAGPFARLAALENRLSEQHIAWRRLDTSHAFHTAMMQEAASAFAELCRGVTLNPPRIPFLSNISGTWIEAHEATDPAYWGRHIRQPVRFYQGIERLLADGDYALLEIGPSDAFGGLLRAQAPLGARLILSSAASRDAAASAQGAMLLALGGLWAGGFEPDWRLLHDGQPRRRVPLPSYPFARQRHWVERGTGLHEVSLGFGPAQHHWSSKPAAEQLAQLAQLPTTTRVTLDAGTLLALLDGIALAPAPQAASPMAAVPAVTDLPSLDERGELQARVAAVWREYLGVTELGLDDNFFTLGGHSLVALQIIARLRSEFAVEIPAASAYAAPTVKAMAQVIDDLLVAQILAEDQTSCDVDAPV